MHYRGQTESYQSAGGSMNTIRLVECEIKSADMGGAVVNV